MYYEVQYADYECPEDERENALNRNASMKKVKVIGDNRQRVKDECVYNKDTESERDYDDRAEDEREDRLYNPVQERENKREQYKLCPVDVYNCIYDEAGDILVRKPKRSHIRRSREDNPKDPVHEFSIACREAWGPRTDAAV